MNQAETISKPPMLPVMEHFYTLQGEGFHQGKAAYFIRLAGCNVGCVWCDVKESWNIQLHPYLPVNTLIHQIKQTISLLPSATKPIVVITGGEPLMHNCSLLTTTLLHEGFATHIETSGSSPLSGNWSWICLSPKKFKAPLPGIFPYTNELKIIVFNKSDFLWAEQNARLVNKECLLYLQPEWSKREKITPLIIDYIKAHPQWRLSLQAHKYIHIP